MQSRLLLLLRRAAFSGGCCTLLVMPSTGTGLYELWKAGVYRNYHPDKLVDLVAR
jgi:hypothetical protein